MQPWNSDLLRRPAPLDPAPGRLLVAAPSLGDPNFRRTVLYLLQHDEDGSAAVVLNRVEPGPESGSDLPEWAQAAPGRWGGPVATDSILALIPTSGMQQHDAGEEGSEDGVTVLPVEMMGQEDLTGLQVFWGHAGWGSGQLASELVRHDWHIVAGSPADVFNVDPQQLWSRILRRQSDNTRLWSTLPEIPMAN